ncbi:hypothetical protein NC652_008918 [Populus alba x Populus x berolinensis]|uniref:Uncharacterized protein n=1 Tax=Populus alba x Populus x berolinensis TaxID=444605 RepID=A0AAD6R7X2_9ROSI|nr:hypothetical protein NC651_008733 [Populus alba x Populus x berolinensis]KAJ6943287.1 hypothetical protein NC652_008918 [Populus alba x Populus x berolinensis]KAJ7003884.1 hypothetical protein NC653_008931 [Populus alba x Populus x berolinensis]
MFPCSLPSVFKPPCKNFKVYFSWSSTQKYP